MVPVSTKGDGSDELPESLHAACLGVSPLGYLTEGSDAPPGDLDPPAEGWTRLRLYVLDAQREGARAAIEAALGRWPEAPRVEALPLDPDWRERWKQWFHGFAVSPRLAVRPPWEPPSGAAYEVVIEPGMAFGTGQHDTTRLCLELVDGLCDAGATPDSLLDVGCGTGILSIAAALMGVPRVVGVDIDTEAIRCAAENSERNGVRSRLDLSTTAIGAVEGRYPLVIANILAHILVGMVDALTARVADGGRLVLSGVAEDQTEDVLAAFLAPGRLALTDTAQRGPWMRLTFALRP